MDDRNRGGESAERKVATTEVHAAWTVLRSRLTDHLMRMTDEGDHLLIELPEGHGPGCTPYAQFAGFGGGIDDPRGAEQQRLPRACAPARCRLLRQPAAHGMARPRRAGVELVPRAAYRRRRTGRHDGGGCAASDLRRRAPAAAHLQRLRTQRRQRRGARAHGDGRRTGRAGTAAAGSGAEQPARADRDGRRDPARSPR